MSLRQPHVTRVLRAVPLPNIDSKTVEGQSSIAAESGVFVGAFSLRAIGEIGVWARLFDSAQIDFRILLIEDGLKSFPPGDVSSAFAPSLFPKIVLGEDPEGRWRALILPDRPERSFAYCLREGIAEPLMIGPPTEDAWDLFQRFTG